MLLDKRALKGSENFQAKFIRVGNEIYIIGPNDDLTYHIELAENEKILEKIIDLKSQNPDMLDGGMMYVAPKVIRIGSVSTSLHIPLTDKARILTIQTLKREYPSFSIKDLSEE